MATVEDCIAEAIAASGGKLTRDEAADIVEKVRRAGRRATAEGDIAGAEQRTKELIAEEAKADRIKAALVRKQAAINAIRRTELDGAMTRMREMGFSPARSLKALMRGDVRWRKSAQSLTWGYESRFVGQNFMAKISEEKPHLERMLSPGIGEAQRGERKAFWDRAGREMWERYDGGKPGLTGDADAKWMADALGGALEETRTTLNRLGANIGELKGYGYMPQWHDPMRLLQVSKDQWVTDMMGWLDLQKTFPDIVASMQRSWGTDPWVSEVRQILGESYDTIVTGKDPVPSAREKGEFTGPPNLARKLEHERSYHFKTYDDFAAQASKYGTESVGQSVMLRLKRSARTAGLMQVFGPNPGSMVKQVAEAERRRVRGDPNIPPKEQRTISLELSRVDHWPDYKIMLGQENGIVSPRVAAIGSGIRAIQQFGKLPSAVISAVLTDPVMTASNLRLHGMSMSEAYGKAFSGYFAGRGEGEARRLAFAVNEGTEGLIDQLNHNATVNAGQEVPGFLSKLAALTFRVTGFTWQYDAGRASVARIIQSELGHAANAAWGDLDKNLRHILELQGLTPERWEVMRQAAWAGENGTKYLTPDGLADLADEQIEPLIAERVKDFQAAQEAQISARERQALEQSNRETDWIEKRRARLQGFVERAQDALDERRGRAFARTKAERELLQAQIDHLKAGMERADAESDVRSALDALGTTREAQALAIQIADAASAVQEAKGVERLGTKLEGQSRRTYAAGEHLGMRKGNAARRVIEAEARMRQKQAAVERESSKWGLDYLKERLDQEADLREFEGRMASRQLSRTVRDVMARQELPSRIAQVREREIANARASLDLDLRRYIADEISYSILKPDDQTKAGTTLGLSRGTLAGEAWRMIAQFKAFPLAFTNRVLNRALRGAPAYETRAESILRQSLHLGELLATLTVAGLFSLWLKDVASGKTPKAIWNDQKGAPNWATLGAAMAQSGGLGIYGDYLFGQYNRFGGDFISTVSGPTVGQAMDIANIIGNARDLLLDPSMTWEERQDKAAKTGQAAFRTVQGDLPFINAWYAKAALDYLFMNSLREAIMPGYLSRQEKYMRQFGQSRILPATAFGHVPGTTSLVQGNTR